jgi:hypothetical protein
MVKMNIQPEPEDLQISKLNEFFLVADRIRKAGRKARHGFGKFKCKLNPSGGNARLSAPTSIEDTSHTNGSFAPPMQSFHAPLITPSAPPLGDALNKEERNMIRTLEVPAALSSPAKCLPPDQITQAISERSDGGTREGHRQWSPLAILLPNISTRATPGATEVIGKPLLSQVLPSQSLTFPRISESLFVFTG